MKHIFKEQINSLERDKWWNHLIEWSRDNSIRFYSIENICKYKSKPSMILLSWKACYVNGTDFL